MSRYLIICKPIDSAPAWVVAESCDEEWARDASLTWRDHVVLEHAEASLDPDFAEAVSAWDVKNDAVYTATMAIEEAEGSLSDAMPDYLREPPKTPHDTKPEDELEVLEVYQRVMATWVEEGYRFSHEGRRDAEAQLVRLIAKDVRSVIQSKRLRII